MSVGSTTSNQRPDGNPRSGNNPLLPLQRRPMWGHWQGMWCPSCSGKQMPKYQWGILCQLIDLAAAKGDYVKAAWKTDKWSCFTRTMLLFWHRPTFAVPQLDKVLHWEAVSDRWWGHCHSRIRVRTSIQCVPENKRKPIHQDFFLKTVMIYQTEFTLLQNSVYSLSFNTGYMMYWPCVAGQRNYFSHRSSGPPVRTHLHTANQSYMIWIWMTCVFGIRVRMRVDLLFYCGEEKRKEYTQDAYNQIYVQKWRPPTAIQIL